MAGIVNGVQANILKEAPCAIYVHCGSHNLNLVLNSANAVPEIRNMMSTVQEVTKFINDSVKRREFMTQQFEEAGSKRTQLINLCVCRKA